MREGYSVIELLVSLVIGAIAIACVGAFGFRQQRFHRDVVAVTERLEQLQQATALVPIAIRSIAPGEGDIPAGGARDTSFEFRATIATAVVCDSGHGVVVLAPVGTVPPLLASVLASPAVGDTIWSLTLAGTNETWTPRPIVAISDTTTACALGPMSPWPGPTAYATIALHVAAPLPAGRGSPVRITRPWRYSLYRSSDGNWYLGARDWNPATLRFNIIQPVSGPFLSAAAHGVAFRYYDSTGAAIVSGGAITRGVALVQITFRVDSVLTGNFAHSIGIVAGAIASASLRNRAR